MNLKTIWKEFGGVISAGAAIVAIAGIVTTYAQMPKKVEAVEENVKKVEKKVDDKAKEADAKLAETKDKVQQVAATVDKYVALNEQQRVDQDKREQLILDLIKAVKDKK